jgi:hypothetical protein
MVAENGPLAAACTHLGGGGGGGDADRPASRHLLADAWVHPTHGLTPWLDPMA